MKTTASHSNRIRLNNFIVRMETFFIEFYLEELLFRKVFILKGSYSEIRNNDSSELVYWNNDPS